MYRKPVVKQKECQSQKILNVGSPVFKSLDPIQDDTAVRKKQSSSRTRYDVLWRKKTNKKNKTWDSDGYAIWSSDAPATLVVYNDDGQRLIETAIERVTEGKIIEKGSIEVQIGEVQVRNASKSSIAPANSEVKTQQCVRKSKPIKAAEEAYVSPVASRPEPENQIARRTEPPAKRAKVNINFLPFKPVVIKQRSKDIPAKISAENESPDINEYLRPLLRPHQIEGVEFMRDCVLGNRHDHGSGCILADDMGLGKTLMAVTLIYTLLKAGCIRNALVVCPVTLLSNWKTEFRKWLGEMRIGVLVANDDSDIDRFFRDSQHRSYQVMVAGYERVRQVAAKSSSYEFDITVCDEGHRLKMPASKLAVAINEISGPKRVILSGTPVQNNLEEFWALSEFVNPGCLGKLPKFLRQFADPIAAGNTPDATNEMVQLGVERSEELSGLTRDFLLRRDHSVLEQYLHVPKTEWVIFCRPSDDQIRVYRDILNSHRICSCFDGSLQGPEAQAAYLRAISMLKQAATSVNLLDTGMRQVGFQQSGGKMRVLSRLLQLIRSETKEKVVLVSGSTKVLDMCQAWCSSQSMQWVRLDGQTPPDRREGIVRLFNRSDADRAFIFLLSARSGGAGLNLIGASRLVLIDCDWNPAIDQQAMARIHRDGQKRAVHIYRLMSTGLIDEKIFQRQLTKLGLSGCILEGVGHKDEFSRDQLRDLFTIAVSAKCNTLDLSTSRDYQEAKVEAEPILAAAAASSGNISCVLSKTSGDWNTNPDGSEKASR